MFAFNCINKNQSRLSGSLKNPTNKDVVNAIYTYLDQRINLFGLTKKYKKPHNLDFLKNLGYFFYVDIIVSFSKVENNLISVTKFRNGKEKEFSIPAELWQNALKNVQIYNNFIKPPYLLIRIVKKEKDKYQTTRAYLIAIADKKEDDTFIPVESEIERQEILKFAKGGKAFFKPIAAENLKQVLGKDIWQEYRKINKKEYRPDLFVFHKGYMEIIEIVDKNNLNNRNYMKILEEKEEIYKKLEKKGKFAYFRAVV